MTALSGTFLKKGADMHVTIKHRDAAVPVDGWQGWVGKTRHVWYVELKITFTEEEKLALAKFPIDTPLRGLPRGNTSLKIILDQQRPPSEFDNEPEAIEFADALRHKILPQIKTMTKFGALKPLDESFEL